MDTTVYDENKMYGSFKIPSREQLAANAANQATRPISPGTFAALQTEMFAEITINGKESKTFPRAQEIRPVTDEKMKMFIATRQIAREEQFRRVEHSKALYKQDQRSTLSKIFYKQAILTMEFEDDFTEFAAFSSYYPYYQLMSYEQFRTYFTWRTGVRNGVIKNTSASYAFVYIYELLNNIGVNDPQDGLDKLMAFWRAFKEYNTVTDKYILKWLKDYFVFYTLPQPFKDFTAENGILAHYSEILESSSEDEDRFDFYCGVSKYNIKNSVFYSEETQKLISGCFNFVMDKLRQVFDSNGISFDELIFPPVKNKFDWIPFEGALFYQCFKQPNKRVAFSDKEIYTCIQNKWSCRTAKESDRQLLGHIMKLMEVSLRKAANFKHKLAAPSDTDVKGVSLEKVINSAVIEFYKNYNKKVITVDETLLVKIRQEALDIQEKLIVPVGVEIEIKPRVEEAPLDGQAQGWVSLRQSLEEMEINALAVILQEGDIKKFSDDNGVMMEVLIDGINQKAFDAVGDTLIDIGESVLVFEEYKEKIMETVMC